MVRQLKFEREGELTLGKFRELTRDLPDETDFQIYMAHWKTARELIKEYFMAQRITVERLPENEVRFLGESQEPPYIAIRLANLDW